MINRQLYLTIADIEDDISNSESKEVLMKDVQELYKVCSRLDKYIRYMSTDSYILMSVLDFLEDERDECDDCVNLANGKHMIEHDKRLIQDLVDRIRVWMLGEMRGPL